MSALSPIAFAAIVWGGIATVTAVFAYVGYVLLREFGWLPPGDTTE